MKIKALTDRVIVSEGKHNVTKSGIIVQEDLDPSKIVIDVVVDSNLAGVSTGDFVVYRRWGSKSVVDGDTKQRYRVLKKEDVLAIFEE